MKEPVFSMELDELPGSRPKLLRKGRNINADQYIQAYLSNEKIKTYPSDIKMRNPLFSDFPYQKLTPGSKNQNVNPNQFQYYQQGNQTNQVKSNQIQGEQQRVEDSIDQLQKQSIVQQQLQNQQQQNIQDQSRKSQDQSQASSKHNSRKSQNYETRSNRADANEYYNNLQQNLQSQINNKVQTERDYQQKLYVRNNVLGSKEFYKPQFDLNVNFDLYNRPKFRDYAYHDASYKEVVELKNKYYLNEMMNNDFVTTSKDYGLGQKGYTKVPIYPSSKPQNIDKE